MSKQPAQSNPAGKIDAFFAKLLLGGRSLEAVQIRKGKRWGLLLKFTQGQGFFVGNYLPPGIKDIAEPHVIKKYRKSTNELLFIDRKSYESYKAAHEKKLQDEENGKMPRQYTNQRYEEFLSDDIPRIPNPHEAREQLEAARKASEKLK